MNQSMKGSKNIWKILQVHPRKALLECTVDADVFIYLIYTETGRIGDGDEQKHEGTRALASLMSAGKR